MSWEGQCARVTVPKVHSCVNSEQKIQSTKGLFGIFVNKQQEHRQQNGQQQHKTFL
jgi:hypothetical protein